MTREEIMSMNEEALNSAVHKKVFEYDWLPFVSPNYSSDIGAAWEVMQKITYGYKRWSISHDWPCITITIGSSEYEIDTDCLEEAICKAALISLID